MDQDAFNPVRTIDRTFSTNLHGMDIKDSKGMKAGKILGSKFNCGTAVMDVPRLYKNGADMKYFINGELPVMMWQPPWLKLIDNA